MNTETVTLNGEIDIVAPPAPGALEVVPITLLVTLALLPPPTLPLLLLLLVPPPPPPPQPLMSTHSESAAADLAIAL